MSRRKQQDYFGSLDYGMDEYDDPIDSMSPEEIRRLADYVEMIQGGRYACRQRRQVVDDNLPVNPVTLYPEEEYSDEEESEETEDANINDEDVLDDFINNHIEELNWEDMLKRLEMNYKYLYINKDVIKRFKERGAMKYSEMYM